MQPILLWMDFDYENDWCRHSELKNNMNTIEKKRLSNPNHNNCVVSKYISFPLKTENFFFLHSKCIQSNFNLSHSIPMSQQTSMKCSETNEKSYSFFIEIFTLFNINSVTFFFAWIPSICGANIFIYSVWAVLNNAQKIKSNKSTHTHKHTSITFSYFFYGWVFLLAILFLRVIVYKMRCCFAIQNFKGAKGDERINNELITPFCKTLCMFYVII